MFTLKNASPKPRLEIKDKTFITREILCVLLILKTIAAIYEVKVKVIYVS